MPFCVEIWPFSFQLGTFKWPLFIESILLVLFDIFYNALKSAVWFYAPIMRRAFLDTIINLWLEVNGTDKTLAHLLTRLHMWQSLLCNLLCYLQASSKQPQKPPQCHSVTTTESSTTMGKRHCQQIPKHGHYSSRPHNYWANPIPKISCSYRLTVFSMQFW